MSSSGTKSVPSVAPKPTSFEIDTDALTRPNSRRPRHLEARMSGRRRATRATKLSADNAAAEIATTTDDDDTPALVERKQRISARLRGIESKVRQHRAQQSDTAAQIQRTLAAQQQQATTKRQQRLHERKHRSAGVVTKAKRVAQAHKEKSAADASRRREQLEERLWSSELRRRILSRVPRSQLLQHTSVAVEVELRAVNSAARRLQRWWRRLRVQPLIKQFRQLTAGTEIQPEVAAKKDLNFDRLLGTVQSPAVIRVVSRLLAAAKMASEEARQRRYTNPSKVFLSAYVIVHHTAHIMPTNSENEQAILSLATAMLDSFEEWMNRGEAHLGTFVAAWHEFHTEFEEWKARDTHALLASMAEHVAELERLRESVKANVDYETEWRARIDGQQRQIHDRMLKIGGRAGLAKFPAVAALTIGAAADGQQQSADGAADTEVMAAQSTSTPSHSVVDSPHYSVTEDKADAAESTPGESKAALAEFGHIFSNEKLAHEIILDPEFELKPQQAADSFEGNIMLMAKKAFFDKIREDVAQQKFDWLPGMVEDIRKQFSDMLEPKGRLAAEINEVLDASHVQQQVDQGQTVNIASLLHFTIQKMLQLCAPIRDAEIRALLTAPDQMEPVSVLQSILRILDEMKLDLVNYRLRAVRPHLMKHAAEYEREKFAAALKAGQVALKVTTEWITAAGRAARATADARNPEKIDIPENRIRFEAVYFDALLSLIFGTTLVSAQNGNCPETLAMDAERLVAFQNESQAITVVASLTMLTRNMIPEMRDAATMQKLKNNLLVLLQSSDTSIASLVAYISSSIREALQPAGKDLSTEQAALIHSMVDKTLSYKDKVFLLLNRRILAAVRSQLNTGKLRRDPKSGLDVVADEVETLSRKVFLLAKHNRAVYAPWYDELIRKSIA